MEPTAADPANGNSQTPAEVLVGRKLHELRTRQRLSLRVLADRSGLNINTLSLIENGKSSPSVSTLQQLAIALEVPIAAFFESESNEKSIVFTSAAERPNAFFGRTRMQNLGENLTDSAVQPFVISLEPGMGSGDQPIVHTGHEFVFCLEGSVHYRVENFDYTLTVGDSLLFEAHLPHCWENISDAAAQILLVLFPADEHDQAGGRHFSRIVRKNNNSMKIAFITDDGKTISQHFGRAPYYLVLTIEEGKIAEREMRNKLGHNQFQSEQHENEAHHEEAGHGMDSASHDRHSGMAAAIADCQALICGGMGRGAYESMRRLNIQPIVTDQRDIESAAQAYIDGKLVDHTEKLH